MKDIKKIIIGILFLIIDFDVKTGFNYPAYLESSDIGKYFQGYVINNIVGRTLYVDIFNDLIGYIFIIVGAAGLIKYSKKITGSMVFSVIAMILYITRPLIPFAFNGTQLCYMALLLGIIMVGVEISVEYFLIVTIVSMTNSMRTEMNNKAMLVAWFIAMTCKVVIGLTNFIGNNGLTIAYSSIMLICTLFYLYKIYLVKDHIHEVKTV